jgi:hypothetical protein
MKLTFLTRDLYNSLIRQGFTNLAFRNKQTDPNTGTIITYEALTPEQSKEENLISLNKASLEQMLRQTDHIYYVMVRQETGSARSSNRRSSITIMG